MTAPHATLPEYRILVGSTVVDVKHDARSAVEALREQARLHGVACVETSSGPVLLSRERGEGRDA